MQILSDEMLGIISCFRIFLLTLLNAPPLTGNITYRHWSSVKEKSYKWKCCKRFTVGGYWKSYPFVLRNSFPSEWQSRYTILQLSVGVVDVLRGIKERLSVTGNPCVHQKRSTIFLFYPSQNGICLRLKKLWYEIRYDFHYITILSLLENAMPVHVSVFVVVIVNLISSPLGTYSHFAEYSQVPLSGSQFLGTFQIPPHTVVSIDEPSLLCWVSAFFVSTA